MQTGRHTNVCVAAFDTTGRVCTSIPQSDVPGRHHLVLHYWMMVLTFQLWPHCRPHRWARCAADLHSDRAASVCRCVRVGDAAVVAVAAGCRKLELLSLHGLRTLTDRSVGVSG